MYSDLFYANYADWKLAVINRKMISVSYDQYLFVFQLIAQNLYVIPVPYIHNRSSFIVIGIQLKSNLRSLTHYIKLFKN